MASQSLLSADDYRRLLEVLEVAGRAGSAREFGECMLAALEEEFGYRMSAFFVSGPLGERLRPIEPVSRGLPASHGERWTCGWGAVDPLNSPLAFDVQRRRGTVDVEQLHGRLDHLQRRYVSDFLRPQGIESQLAFHLDTGLTRQGYGSLASPRGTPLTAIDHARVAALLPHMANMLRLHLTAPRTADAALSQLSAREAEVAELVAAGLTNSEIGRLLHVTEATVKQHVSRILRKLGRRNRTELTVAWGSGSDPPANP